MKKIFLTLLCLFSLNFSFSQIDKSVKIKTFKTEKLTVSYPKTWMKIGAQGYVFFQPKKLRKTNNKFNETEYVSVNMNDLKLQARDSIENVLKNHGNSFFRSHKTKSFKLIKLESSSKFIYKMVSIITYKTIPGVYKNEAYYFMNNGHLKFYYYQMRETLFEEYHDDAMLIINSIREKN
jgi:hypothetical protein